MPMDGRTQARMPWHLFRFDTLLFPSFFHAHEANIPSTISNFHAIRTSTKIMSARCWPWRALSVHPESEHRDGVVKRKIKSIAIESVVVQRCSSRPFICSTT